MKRMLLFILAAALLCMSAYADATTFEKGSKGDDVKALQQRLIDLYWLDDVADGIYGNKTKDAVERFQAAAGLTVDGIADPETQELLFSDDAPEDQLTIRSASIIVGSYGETAWYVNGLEFTLKGKQTRTIKTPWGTYRFNAFNEYEKIAD